MAEKDSKGGKKDMAENAKAPYEFFDDDVKELDAVCQELDAAEGRLVEKAKKLKESRRVVTNTKAVQREVIEMHNKLAQLQTVIENMKASLFARYDA